MITELVFALMLEICPPSPMTACHWVPIPTLKNPYPTRLSCNQARKHWKYQFQGLARVRCDRKEKNK